MELHVTFKGGTSEYALPASEVLHLDSYTGATPVPGTPAYVAGLVQVRGRLVPVVDLRARFGLPPIEHSIDRRVVVIQCEGRVAGLLVDSAREVVRLDPASFEKPPDALDHGHGKFVRAIAAVKQRLLLLVDVPRVIGEEVGHAQ